MGVVSLMLIWPAKSLYMYVYRIWEIFVGLNFRYQALKACFRGLIYAVCPEHIIIVAYLSAATIRMSTFSLVDFPSWGSP